MFVFYFDWGMNEGWFLFFLVMVDVFVRNLDIVLLLDEVNGVFFEEGEDIWKQYIVFLICQFFMIKMFVLVDLVQVVEMLYWL